MTTELTLSDRDKEIINRDKKMIKNYLPKDATDEQFLQIISILPKVLSAHETDIKIRENLASNTTNDLKRLNQSSKAINNKLLTYFEALSDSAIEEFEASYREIHGSDPDLDLPEDIILSEMKGITTIFDDQDFVKQRIVYKSDSVINLLLLRISAALELTEYKLKRRRGVRHDKSRTVTNIINKQNKPGMLAIVILAEEFSKIFPSARISSKENTHFFRVASYIFANFLDDKRDIEELISHLKQLIREYKGSTSKI